MNLNQCNFIGRLGQEPEIRYMPNGDAVANLSIAISEKWKDKQGQQQERTEWVRMTAYRKLAEIIGEYVSKGSLIYASGKMQTRKWQNQQGQDQYSTEIILSEMKMLSGNQSNKGQTNQQDPRQQRSNNNYQQPQNKRSGAADEFIDDIPFRLLTQQYPALLNCI